MRQMDVHSHEQFEALSLALRKIAKVSGDHVDTERRGLQVGQVVAVVNSVLQDWEAEVLRKVGIYQLGLVHTELLALVVLRGMQRLEAEAEVPDTVVRTVVGLTQVEEVGIR